MPVTAGGGGGTRTRRNSRSPGAADRAKPPPPRKQKKKKKAARPNLSPAVPFRPTTEQRRDKAAESRNATKKKKATKGKSNSPNPRAPASIPGNANGTPGVLPRGKAVRNEPIHPLAAPLNIHGGTKHRPGRLRRVPKRGEPAIYEWHFLYNPTTISVATGINIDATFDAADVGSNYASAAQTISWGLMINRTNELAQGLRGGEKSGHPAVHGTLHDLELLYRITNGPPQRIYGEPAGASGEKNSFTAYTADIGFLYANPVEVHFGDKLRYAGVIQNITVDHLLFNKDMVPMITEVKITMSRITGQGVQQGVSNKATEGES